MRAPRILETETANETGVEAQPVALQNVAGAPAAPTSGAPDANMDIISAGMKVEVAVADAAHKQLLYHLKNYDSKEPGLHGAEASDLVPEPGIRQTATLEAELEDGFGL